MNDEESSPISLPTTPNCLSVGTASGNSIEPFAEGGAQADTQMYFYMWPCPVVFVPVHTVRQIDSQSGEHEQTRDSTNSDACNDLNDACNDQNEEDFHREMEIFMAQQHISVGTGLERTSSIGSNDSPPFPSTLSREASNASAYSVSAMEMFSSMVHGLDEQDKKDHPEKEMLFQSVEASSRSVLAGAFERLELVGSAALKIDNPFSDLDAVLFCTAGTTSSFSPVLILQSIAHVCNQDPKLRAFVIESARVPILNVVSSTDGKNFSIDVSVEQETSVAHVRWFEDFGVATPKTSPMSRVPEPANMREQALFLRSVKWWLNRRALPTTKEGGFPTIVWLLMAAHIYKRTVFNFLGDQTTHPQGSRRGLLRMLTYFFGFFGNSADFHGTIHFDSNGATHFEPLAVGKSSTNAKDTILYVAAENREDARCNAAMTEIALRQYFEGFGEVVRVAIPIDHDHAKPCGYAFVTMADHASQRAALLKRNHNVSGMPVKVGRARRGHKFRVHNLPFKANEEHLRTYFSSFGKVDDAAIESKGSGSVTMSELSGAAAVDEAAVKKQLVLSGRSLVVQRESKKRTDIDAVANLLSTFSVLDPTSPNKDLAPQMSKATKLLLISELRRAHDLLSGLVTGERGMGSARINSLFEQVDEGANQLPTSWQASLGKSCLSGVLFLSVCTRTLNIGVLEDVEACSSCRKLPNLDRRDTKSKVHVLLCDIAQGPHVVSCSINKDRPKAVIYPCSFVCRVELEKSEDSDTWFLIGHWLDRYLCIKAAHDTLAPPQPPAEIEQDTKQRETSKRQSQQKSTRRTNPPQPPAEIAQNPKQQQPSKKRQPQQTNTRQTNGTAGWSSHNEWHGWHGRSWSS